MTTLKQQYQKTMTPALAKQLGIANVWQLPRLVKIVVSIGLGPGLKDPKFTEAATATIKKITGQQPLETHARQSISNFKIRQGQVIGLKVTLRGERMHSFLEKLVHVTLPRVRDFRGLELSSIDQRGNLSIGLKENIAFPEISTDEVEKIHGVEITIVTSARTRNDAIALFKLLGMPFKAS